MLPRDACAVSPAQVCLFRGIVRLRYPPVILNRQLEPVLIWVWLSGFFVYGGRWEVAANNQMSCLTVCQHHTDPTLIAYCPNGVTRHLLLK